MAGPSVALVLVSHSRALADGVAELAGQMAPDVALLAAGGTDDGGLGTGFDRVLAAMESALTDGRSAVVLTDLGSAILTTESVLEMLDADDAARVRLAHAPFVEGAVEAAVAAQGGGDVDAVLAAARHAGTTFGEGDSEDPTSGPLAPGHAGADAPTAPSGEGAGLGPAQPSEPGGRVESSENAERAEPGERAETMEPGVRAEPGVQAEPGEPESGTSSEPSAGAGSPAVADSGDVATTARETAVLRNRLGLHARPAAAIARTAGGFRSRVTIDGADARSVLSLVALGAVGGREVVVSASGPDARTAVDAVVAELEQGFGEA